jgi:uncharacterized repeat protein (TIGR04138 family)
MEEFKGTWQRIKAILERDSRYRVEAYLFLLAALEHSLNKLEVRRHLTGGELLAGIKDYAIEQYGPMAYSVLESWGVRTTDDFGAIVFNLVNAGVLSKTPEDRIEDFHNVYDFKEVFLDSYPWGRE